MTQQITDDPMGDSAQRRSRGPTKPFPSITFEEALFLPKSILEHGVNGEIQRLTLLRELDVSPSSSKTRNLISSSHKYGLTEGSYNAPSLSVTDAGRVVSGNDCSQREVSEKGFQLAINQFNPFRSVYDKLKDNRLRDGAVLRDEFRRIGVPDADCQQAVDVFTANLRFLDLVHDIAGNEYVRAIEQVIEDTPASTDDNPAEPSAAEPVTETAKTGAGASDAVAAPNRPALHIDIQVHIDPTSSAELIDQIFASMAKHLYRYES